MTASASTSDLFAARAERFGHVLDGVSDSAWDAPTPCSDWTVRDVVAHIVETERDFLARHDLPAGTDPDPAGAADPAAAWREHAAATASALDADGVAERAFDGYFGPTTVGATMAEFYGWDLVVHGWDVARATGQPYAVDDAEATALSTAADAWGDTLYTEGVCRRPVAVPDDASPFERLLGRLGRDPRWAPSASAQRG